MGAKVDARQPFKILVLHYHLSRSTIAEAWEMGSTADQIEQDHYYARNASQIPCFLLAISDLTK